MAAIDGDGACCCAPVISVAQGFATFVQVWIKREAIMMKAYAALLTIVFVAISSQAFARSGWCGNFARHNLVTADPGSKYNLACNWRDWGRATSAQVGAMVIWCSHSHRHVGKIVGPCNGNMCLVKSGNDGGAVRTRMRSVAGAIFRI